VAFYQVSGKPHAIQRWNESEPFFLLFFFLFFHAGKGGVRRFKYRFCLMYFLIRKAESAGEVQVNFQNNVFERDVG
jgi:hypothetical protein